MKLNIDYMLETIWKLLNLIRIYTKKRGEKPDFEGGLIIRSGTTVEHVVSLLSNHHLIDFIQHSVVWFIEQWLNNSNMLLFG